MGEIKCWMRAIAVRRTDVLTSLPYFLSWPVALRSSLQTPPAATRPTFDPTHFPPTTPTLYPKPASQDVDRSPVAPPPKGELLHRQATP